MIYECPDPRAVREELRGLSDVVWEAWMKVVDEHPERWSIKFTDGGEISIQHLLSGSNEDDTRWERVWSVTGPAPEVFDRAIERAKIA